MSNHNLLDKYISELKLQITQGLPGVSAQIEMAPLPDVPGRFDIEDRKKARQSAVMILMFQEDNKIKFPLILRPKYPGVHSGQVALPGGKFELEDESLTHTAIRETFEEVGVAMSEIEVIGSLTDLYIPPSNFNILPVIGFARSLPKFDIDHKEVEELLIAEISELNDPAIRKVKKIAFHNNVKADVPYFDIENQTVWGATAMILSEFSTLINKINIQK